MKTILNRYLSPHDAWNKPCSKLSGGEKMRLSFCCLMIADNTPDMFILDEPTNNLDIESIEIITATIRDYAGTVIAISHDREFLKDTGIEREILLEWISNLGNNNRNLYTAVLIKPAYFCST